MDMKFAITQSISDTAFNALTLAAFILIRKK